MPSTVIGNQQTQLDDTTMIIYRSGNRMPVNPDRKRDLARRCGVNCILLRYKESLESTVGITGFQNVKLIAQQGKGGRIEPVARWHVNELTNEPFAEGAADFVPDEMGTGYAYIPDSPFNRVRLAYAIIANNALWDIEDDRTRGEIEALANEIKLSPEFRKEMEDMERRKMEVAMRVKEKNVATGIEHKSALEIEVKVLEERVKELEAKKKRDALKKKLAELQQEMPELAGAEIKKEAEPVVEADVAETVEPVAEEEIKPPKNVSVREKAKADVYNDNRELIDATKEEFVKRTGGMKGWGYSKEYRSKVQPLIDARIKELKAAHEHTAVSNVT